MDAYAKLRQEAVDLRDKSGYRSFKHIDELMAVKGNNLSMGKGWHLVFDFEFMGYKMVNARFTPIIPEGIPICPIPGCLGLTFGGQVCTHAPSQGPHTVCPLFQNGTFDPIDLGKLYDELEEHFQLKMLPGNVGDDYVYQKMLKETFTSSDLNVSVRRPNPNSTTLEIKLLTSGQLLYTCEREGCKAQGVVKTNVGYLCQQHTSTKRWDSKYSSTIMWEAITDLFCRVNSKNRIEENDYAGWLRMMRYVRTKFGDHYMEIPKYDGFVRLRVTSTGQFQKQTNYSTVWLGVCYQPMCKNGTGKAASSAFWCKTHAKNTHILPSNVLDPLKAESD